jgi:hypothetical protein
MISQTMQEIITFQPLITDQAQLIKIISDQLGIDMEPINITSPLITVDNEFNTLYIIISYNEMCLKKTKNLEQNIKKMKESLEEYFIRSYP